MASHTLPPADGASDLINYAVRMVIPMRREFGCTLDVTHFLHDFAYARAVLDQARSSRDARLREYADYLETKMFGPRNGPADAARPAASAPSAASAMAEPAATPEPAPSEEALRERMLRRYRSSLR